MTRRKPRTPDSVMIGPYTIRVESVAMLADEDGRRCHGAFGGIPGGGYGIQIDSKESGASEADTLIHEILEAIVSIRDLKINHSAIQTIATDLAQALYPDGLPRRR